MSKTILLVLTSMVCGCGFVVGLRTDYELDDASSDAAAVDGSMAFDASVDGSLDGTVVLDGGCPPVCSQCLNGTCVITDPVSPPTCPAGIPCRVECTKKNCMNITCGSATACRVECANGQGCASITIECGSGPCTITCGNNQGCSSVTIVPNQTPHLCMECRGGNGCNATMCNIAAPNMKSCNGNSCSNVTGCGPFMTVSSCN